jgi:putative MATE family efflux protein
MDRTAAKDALPVLPSGREESTWALLRQLLLLAGPVLVEHILHAGVGLTDTYLANHLPADKEHTAAAVGTIAYFLWFFNLIVASIATGSTALIARARGARHRSLANSVTGQSIMTALMLGAALTLVVFTFAPAMVWMTGLQGKAQDFALAYLRILSFSLPFSTVMFVANACQRGHGDTLTPAIAMVTVDTVNVALTFSLTRGYGPIPELGFVGIAWGTAAAYTVGGVLQMLLLLAGRRGLKLHPHRMRPHATTLKRILRIGIPSGLENIIAWAANFALLVVVNRINDDNVSPAAHVNTIRVESISFMLGFAFAMAAATMVGQSLGMRQPRRATRSAYLAFACAGTAMTICGAAFILFSRQLAGLISDDPRITDVTARCLFITGWIQTGFAASAVFSGALRGAGDTLAVMILNLCSVLGVRLIGVMIIGWYFRASLPVIWMVLSAELFVRGLLMYGRFLHGGWRTAKV